MSRREPHDQIDDLHRWPAVTRGELLAVVLVVLLGAALRFAYPSRLAVEHFDEGVYASNIWFGEANDYRYPARHLYAPPLLPALIEWSIILFGAGAVSVKLVSLLAGTATVAVVWWVARRWFGKEAGIAAASLAALSDVHILYSRMVLTDVLMCLWLLIAVGCVHEMLARGRQGWAVAAGVATGLAWATKYNGWLPLAIAVSGFVFYALVMRWKSKESPVAWRGFAISLLLMTVTAAVVWSPAWFDLQDRGGYAAVAANHRGYLGGLDSWLASFERQVGNHRYLEGWLSIAAISLAVIAAYIVRRRKGIWKTIDRRGTIAVVAVLLPTAAVLLLPTVVGFCGQSLTLGLLAVVGICLHLSGRSPVIHSTLPACLLAVWFVGLFLATPFYHPYPRLTLPWLVAAWLGSGAAIGLFVRRMAGGDEYVSTRSREHFSRWILVKIVLCVTAALLVAAISRNLNRPLRPGIPGWQSQTGLKNVAADITRQVKTAAPNDDVLVQIYAEPALFFHLAAQRDPRLVAVPIGTLGPPTGSFSVPAYLVTGPNAHREAKHRTAIKQFGDRLELIAEYPFRPSDIVLLNWNAPSQLTSPDPHEYRVRLYRLK